MIYKNVSQNNPQDLKIIIVLLFITLSTQLFGQEAFWNRFRPQEFSEPVFILKNNNIQSFDLVIPGDEKPYPYKFLNDSVITQLDSELKYVLRNDLVLPVLDKSDSLDFLDFWRDKIIKKYDSLNVDITEYYESNLENENLKLTFKSYNYPDSTVEYSYDVFDYVHTSIPVKQGDSTITNHKWVSESGIDYSIETYSRKTTTQGNSSNTIITYRLEKIGKTEPAEIRRYEVNLLYKKNNKRLVRIIFTSNISGYENYSVENFKYKKK
ncbi:MAG: hypothetical protein KJ941_13010 [Bacteroidetes bacterium]|nr:hypothetical protein [Bacteroidota bacterium]